MAFERASVNKVVLVDCHADSSWLLLWSLLLATSRMLLELVDLAWILL